MRTPAGVDCRHFYGDYFRGRNVETCRLLQANGEKWEPRLCQACPVPGILMANACGKLRLKARVRRSVRSVFARRVHIEALCDATGAKVAEPYVGCGSCVADPAGYRPAG